MQNPLQDISLLKKKSNDLFYSIQEIKSQRDLFVKKEQETLNDLLRAKKRLEIKNDVKDHLNTLQNISQKKSIGLFTQLLTAMVHDVLPKNKDQNVHFELSTKRDKPNLDIMMKVSDTHYEDIMDGRGGSLTNVVSTGLRYITLSRTRNRRFMVLDEPDNWVNVEAVPRFAKVISDISKKVGVQTLTITHKNPDLYNARVIELYRNNSGEVCSRTIQEDKDDGYINSDEYEDINRTQLMDNVGIKRIKFKNFMSLKNVEIELSPTMNVIVGEGDIGKSAIFAGINTFVNNNCHAKQINHDADSFSIEIEVESGIVLHLEHKRKGAKKTIYKMEIPTGNGDTEVISEENGSTVPDFIAEALSMEPIDGINIQLGHQKSSPFMLGPDTTSSKRADLLSLGRESDYIHQMISLYSTEVKEDASLVKKSEKSIVEIRDKIEILNTISDIEDKFNSIKDILDETIDSKKVMHDIESLIKNLDNCQKDILGLNSVTEIHNFNVEVKINNQSMLNDIVSMGQELRNIEKTIDSLNTISELETIDNIEIKNIDESLFNELESNGNEIKQLQSNFTNIKNKMIESSKEIESIIQESGGVCPLCHQNIEHSHLQKEKD